jgi:hypothetical protein
MNLKRPMRTVYARLLISAIVLGVLLALGVAVPADPVPGALAHVARMAHP